MIEAIRWSSLALWLVWLTVYWKGGRDLISGLMRSFHSSRSRYDTFLILGIVVLSNVMLWTGYLVATGRIEGQLLLSSVPLSTVGGALILGGGLGTFYCRQRLGGSWSAQTALAIDHKLVDSGPYRFVRHPIYSFACAMTLGTTLVFLTWWNVLAAMAVLGLYVLKALKEEETLAEGLPGYRDYQQRVRYRIVPWMW
jgi:protein-S-isoprenylcysteine O-methyltransferase Ste14